MKGVKESFHMSGAYVIHKHAAWLCLGCMFAMGLLWGFVIALVVLI